MNLVVMKIERALAAPERSSLSALKSRSSRRQKFAFYFFEQSLALLGTWAQQAVLSWLIHGSPQALSFVGAINPRLGATLGFLGGGLSWFLLTLWTYKIRERIGHVIDVSNFSRRAVPAVERLPKPRWVEGGERSCC